MGNITYENISLADNSDLRIMGHIKDIDSIIAEWRKDSEHDRSARFEIYKEYGLFDSPQIVKIVKVIQYGKPLKRTNIFFNNGLLLV